MDKDRTWMNHRGINDRRKPDYIAGVNHFLECAFHGKEEGTELRCPCVNCNLCFFHNRSTIHNHLIIRGILRNYSPWIHHGEGEDQTNRSDHDIEEDSVNDVDNFGVIDDMRPLVQDAAGISDRFGDHADSQGGHTEVPTTFDKLMEDAEAEQYHGCKTFSRLEFIVTLLHIKENEDLDKCPKCHASRWKEKINPQCDSGIDIDDEGSTKMGKVPRLVLRHFPLIPRLQRMFMSSKLAEHMIWHKEKRPDDGKMRHPADSIAWKHVDELYPNFASEREGHKRGPTRGLKSLREREKNPTVKSFAKITPDMQRVVGKNANRFISECSKWVKEFCPLNTRNWIRMNTEVKERLLDKIKAEWNLPSEVEGIDVNRAIELQCMLLFRGWRYRLKELHFTDKTITEAINSRPPEVQKDQWDWLVNHWADPKQQRISEKNRTNRLKQTITPSNGAKSTARIYHDEILPALLQPQDPTQAPSEVLLEGSTQDPPYVTLWEKTKRHKDGTWDPDARAKYDEFKELHRREIEQHGVDNLHVQEAYVSVLKEKSGYIRGLGPGPVPPKKGREAFNEARAELTVEIQEMRKKEAALQGEIGELKSANAQLKDQMEQMKAEALERENRLKQEAIEREFKQKEEAIEREKKLKEELMTMFHRKFG